MGIDHHGCKQCTPRCVGSLEPPARRPAEGQDPMVIRDVQQFTAVVRVFLGSLTRRDGAKARISDDARAFLADLKVRVTKGLSDGTQISVEIGHGERRLYWGSLAKTLLILVGAIGAGAAVMKWTTIAKVLYSILCVLGTQ
jgi:hypothetical protein